MELVKIFLELNLKQSMIAFVEEIIITEKNNLFCQDDNDLSDHNLTYYAHPSGDINRIMSHSSDN